MGLALSPPHPTAATGGLKQSGGVACGGEKEEGARSVPTGGSSFSLTSDSLLMPGIAEDLGGGGGEVVEGESL